MRSLGPGRWETSGARHSAGPNARRSRDGGAASRRAGGRLRVGPAPRLGPPARATRFQPPGWRAGLSGAVFLLGLVLLPAMVAGAELDAPTALVVRVTEALVAEAKSQGEALRRDSERAYALADRLVMPVIDFPAIARRILGPPWRNATPEQQGRFLAEYETLVMRTLVAAYVEHIDKVPRYGERITYLPTRWDPDAQGAVVRSRLPLTSGLPLDVEYQMRQAEGAWKIQDVRVAGVSLVQANQVAFVRELASGGIESLTSRLATHNAGVAGERRRASTSLPCCD